MVIMVRRTSWFGFKILILARHNHSWKLFRVLFKNIQCVTLTNSETSSSLLKNNQKFYTLTQSSPHHHHPLHVLVQKSDNKHCNNNVLYKCQYSTLPLTCGFADTLTANIMSWQMVCSVLGYVWTNIGPVWKTTALSALWIRPVCWCRGLFRSL